MKYEKMVEYIFAIGTRLQREDAAVAIKYRRLLFH